jgi:peptide/nickel transport system permease protein
MAILLITHDWGVVADICDRAIVMYAGQIVEQGEVRQLVQEPLHPYTKALLMSNPQRGVHGQRLVTIRGSVPRIGEWNAGCRFFERCDYAPAECADAIVPLEDLPSGRETRCLHFEELRTSKVATEVAG